MVHTFRAHLKNTTNLDESTIEEACKMFADGANDILGVLSSMKNHAVREVILDSLRNYPLALDENKKKFSPTVTAKLGLGHIIVDQSNNRHYNRSASNDSKSEIAA